MDKEDAKGGKRKSKRAEIQEIATRVVYQNGFRATTLADIAKAADIPVGSVYYYFKTKTELGEAIVGHLTGQAKNMLERWGADDTPKQRLIKFASMTKEARHELVLYGCPIGTLCAEFGKDFPELLDKAGRIYALVIDWMEGQFAQFSPTQDARQKACQLMASLEGISLIAQGLGDPNVVEMETTRLIAWIENL